MALGSRRFGSRRDERWMQNRDGLPPQALACSGAPPLAGTVGPVLKKTAYRFRGEVRCRGRWNLTDDSCQTSSLYSPEIQPFFICYSTLIQPFFKFFQRFFKGNQDHIFGRLCGSTSRINAACKGLGALRTWREAAEHLEFDENPAPESPNSSATIGRLRADRDGLGRSGQKQDRSRARVPARSCQDAALRARCATFAALMTRRSLGGPSKNRA